MQQSLSRSPTFSLSCLDNLQKGRRAEETDSEKPGSERKERKY